MRRSSWTAGPSPFERHEYLRAPYEDHHPDQVEMKAAQLGLTSKAMLRAMYGARYRQLPGHPLPVPLKIRCAGLLQRPHISPD